MISAQNKIKIYSSGIAKKAKRYFKKGMPPKTAPRFSKLRTKKAIVASPPTSMQATKVRAPDIDISFIRSSFARICLKLLIKSNKAFR